MVEKAAVGLYYYLVDFDYDYATKEILQWRLQSARHALGQRCHYLRSTIYYLQLLVELVDPVLLHIYQVILARGDPTMR